jgi:hypothetical protein
MKYHIEFNPNDPYGDFYHVRDEDDFTVDSFKTHAKADDRIEELRIFDERERFEKDFEPYNNQASLDYEMQSNIPRLVIKGEHTGMMINNTIMGSNYFEVFHEEGHAVFVDNLKLFANEGEEEKAAWEYAYKEFGKQYGFISRQYLDKAIRNLGTYIGVGKSKEFFKTLINKYDYPITNEVLE